MFSIVIPTKNEEENLKKLFQSLLIQDIQPKEVIVSDDSTDRTREIAKKYGAKVVQGVSNGLIGVGRNNGAEAVTTDIILFLDADVTLPPGFLRKFVYRFLSDDLDVATCFLRANGKKIPSWVYFKVWNFLKRFGSTTKQVVAEAGTCMIVKKSVFEKVGGFNTYKKLGEDADFIKKVLKIGGKYKVLPMKVSTSDRRFSIAPHKLAIQLVGLAGIGILGIVSWKLLEKQRRKLEKLYGETGGKDKKTGKQMIKRK